MKNSNCIEIKRRARLWGIYEVTPDGLSCVGREVTLKGRPSVQPNQYAIPIEKGHIRFSMPYDVFIENATKSDFIKEVPQNEN